MSELKDYRIPTRSGNVCHCYLKSEADKLIATLTDKANYYERAYKNKSKELADTCRFYEDELRHHKFKRCLAMAKSCKDLHDRYQTEYDCDEGFGDGMLRWIRWATKWHNRWLQLADEFKADEVIIKYDKSQEKLVRKLLENKDLVIGLDVAEGNDKCVEVTYCIRNKDDILNVETLQIKELK